MGEWLRFTIFAALGLCIGIIDFRTLKIPNLLLILLISTLVGIDLLCSRKLIPYRLLAALGSFGLFYFVYRVQGGLGFGDVKYAGIIGYYLGPKLVLSGLLCAVLLGLLFWCAGRLIFQWDKGKRFSLGPWLGCGAIAAVLIQRGVT